MSTFLASGNRGKVHRACMSGLCNVQGITYRRHHVCLFDNDNVCQTFAYLWRFSFQMELTCAPIYAFIHPRMPIHAICGCMGCAMCVDFEAMLACKVEASAPQDKRPCYPCMLTVDCWAGWNPEIWGWAGGRHKSACLALAARLLLTHITASFHHGYRLSCHLPSRTM